jgi:hypothetical protein
MTKIFRVCSAVVLSVALGGSAARCSTITASLFSPLPPSGTSTVVSNLTGIPTASQDTLANAAYTIAFAGTGSNQGVVNGALVGAHAVPVAGVTGGLPEYLTGNFGSAVTSNIAAAGNYFSTGLGTITITFASPQTSFALLWGSIDTGNSLRFNDAGSFVVSGTAVQNAAAGFVGNGFQGPGGSAWVEINTDTPFTTVTASSSVPSFEFAAIAASTTPFDPVVPEPISTALMGSGILFLIAYRLRQTKRTARSN